MEQDNGVEALLPLTDLEHTAWDLIKNACGGDWQLANKDWRKAAERWRGEYYEQVGNLNAGGDPISVGKTNATE